MQRLVFIDVDDTLLSPPYAAVRFVGRMLGKQFPPERDFVRRSHLQFFDAFPEIFRSSREMWGMVLLSLPFGYFRSQKPLTHKLDLMSQVLSDHRVYLLSKNPPSFTRWRVKHLEAVFKTQVSDRYIPCGPILRRGTAKLEIIRAVAKARNVLLSDCLLIDDSIENIRAASSAGVHSALVNSSWNEKEIITGGAHLDLICRIDPEAVANKAYTHLASDIQRDIHGTFLIPPLTLRSVLPSVRQLIRRKWLYGSHAITVASFVPIARNKYSSFLFAKPHQKICKRISSALEKQDTRFGLRLAAKGADDYTTLLPMDLTDCSRFDSLKDQTQAIRLFARARSEDSKAHTVPKNMFLFDGYTSKNEIHRICSSTRVKKAIETFALAHKVPEADAREKAYNYAKEICAKKTYFGCFFLQFFMNELCNKIFRKFEVSIHPDISAVEKDAFIVYASTHRSYLDGGILFAAIANHAPSFPFIVAADKMRRVWIGKLGARAGAFFLQRKFVDNIYAAILEEHLAAMQRPGSSIQIFLEGQRSRSGLTLPPKKGIASMIWQNIKDDAAAPCKVVLVPVSFAYNKLPESEVLVLESYEERKKNGLTTLREAADIKIKTQRKKSRTQQARGAWRRLTSKPVSECYVQFAKPIALTRIPDIDAKKDRAHLQSFLDAAMCSINTTTMALPTSLLSFALVSTKDHHIDKEQSILFLRMSKHILALYKTDPFFSQLSSKSEEKEFEEFIDLPFINRKFKRHRLKECDIASVTDLDLQRVTYYRNNVFHFFVLPALLIFVVCESKSGRTDELHRFLDSVFEKIQRQFFVPPITSPKAFIDDLLKILSTNGYMTVEDKMYRLSDAHIESPFIQSLSGVGSDIMNDELAALMERYKRTYRRHQVDISVNVTSVSAATAVKADIVNLGHDLCYVQCANPPKSGDSISLSTNRGEKESIMGVVVSSDSEGVTVRKTQAAYDSETTSWVAKVKVPDDMDHGAHGLLQYVREVDASGRIIDLSFTGAFIQTPRPFAKGSCLTCRLPFEDGDFELSAHVTRLSASGVGVQFFDVTPAEQAKLQTLIGSTNLLPR